MKKNLILTLLTALLFSISDTSLAQQGYYMSAAIHGNNIVFTSEGDLWRVGIDGGTAVRLTTSHGYEASAAISPDGKTIAFSAQYEGPTEIYTMPFTGGIPTRRTYDGATDLVVGWTPDGNIIYATNKYSSSPDWQLFTFNLVANQSKIIALAQADDGVFDKTGDTLFFTRLPAQSSHTKRYKGGTAQNIWRYIKGTPEATPLTGDYAGTSKEPMLWRNRVYFLSDRGKEGTMNIWSMDHNGKDLKQETFNVGFSAAGASLDNGNVIYQCGADLHLYHIATGKDAIIPITLSSDFDQQATTWVKDPMKYLTSADISPDGKSIALTARGQVFVAPAKQGRFVEVTRKSGVRYRNAQFTNDGKNLVLQSDESGEVEFWNFPANGVGSGVQLTHDGRGFRFQGIPSPDGKRIVYTDKKNRLLVYSSDTRKTSVIDSSAYDNFSDMRWSPDGKWLASVISAANTFSQIIVYNIADKRKTVLTDDRVNSYSPAWDPNGKWIYFLSDRTFSSLVPTPWGAYQPEPFFNRTTGIYAIALQKDERFPFAPNDELDTAGNDTLRTEKNNEKTAGKAGKENQSAIKIDLNGIQNRISKVPVRSGNYGSLTINGNALFFMEKIIDSTIELEGLTIGNSDAAIKTIVPDIKGYTLSGNGKQLMVRKENAIYVTDANAEPAKDISKNMVDLSQWTFSFNPQEEWKEMFVEAWRLESNYFYDPDLHGVNYEKMLKMYLPLADRVRDRTELNDLIAQIVSELSALHTFVIGGDIRTGSQKIQIGSLGAVLAKDAAAGGYKIQHIYQSEPDYISAFSPLLKQGVNVQQGDIIVSINGVPTLQAASPNELLQNQVGKQVLLHLKSHTTQKEFDAIVTPISQADEANLRYDQWEYTRRTTVDSQSNNEIGYVHLRAMGGANYSEWIKQFYPVFNRKGLIIDMRYNRGGNIDSWILEKLLRKAWMYWKPRAGNPLWNMQYAFTGHIVVLCNEYTASDGEAFTEGFRRLGLGKIIGTRTWGGEIWLSLDNPLQDNGIASAAEMGVYGPEGKWLIEGHGVDPDIVVDNTPHKTFEGQDAQLQAAISYLKKEIKDHPVTVPPSPKYPDKSVEYNR